MLYLVARYLQYSPVIAFCNPVCPAMRLYQELQLGQGCRHEPQSSSLRVGVETQYLLRNSLSGKRNTFTNAFARRMRTPLAL
jgi:hypothetical protein